MAESGLTTFLAPLCDGSVLGPVDKGTKIAQITDGTSNTIAAVEVADEAAVPWTKPEMTGRWTRRTRARD